MPNECEFCDVEHTVVVPCIHLNGSTPENLRDDLQDACGALHNAIQKLEAAAPNLRDYYVYDQDGQIGRCAILAHQTRCAKLQAVRIELGEMFEHVCNVIDFQDEERRNRREKRA